MNNFFLFFYLVFLQPFICMPTKRRRSASKTTRWRWSMRMVAGPNPTMTAVVAIFGCWPILCHFLATRTARIISSKCLVVVAVFSCFSWLNCLFSQEKKMFCGRCGARLCNLTLLIMQMFSFNSRTKKKYRLQADKKKGWQKNRRPQRIVLCLI